ncbi:zinc finger FYVE domain-containing protein 21-like isoform X1 [Macrosteles quadrilineatus]|uniref:zinc finger FYVE domain-containing protein 21-like isoform X1 n=1 Tax=Macrosteles quadrilineatus TaxID=74068 RepID=UPI0023E17B75|nr:zinc finger FYVE domain-containing protein 21-like isoform X1 [Macrosteles quadrilineatus]
MSKENTSKKLIRSKSGLRIVAADENYESPFHLCEPQWIPDKEAPACTRCGIKFGFTTRRHHCRRCGQIYCSGCCDHKLDLPRMCFIDPVRVCKNCTPATLQENKFFDQQLKTLINGATFTLETGQIHSSNDILQCKLSPDHRQLLFDGVKLAPLDLITIQALQVDKDSVTATINEEDEPGMRSVEIEFSVANTGEKSTVKLATTSELEHRKAGVSWIAAMQQAFKMLQDYQAELWLNLQKEVGS